LRGTRREADIVFPSARVAVFVDGCFWHGCPNHATIPSANRRFWEAKLDQNRLRDRDTDERLGSFGWTVIRVWEHEDPSDAANRIARVLSGRRARDASLATVHPAT